MSPRRDGLDRGRDGDLLPDPEQLPHPDAPADTPAPAPVDYRAAGAALFAQHAPGPTS
jgi:hypothetical protein